MIRFLVSSDIHGCVMPYRYSDKKPCDHGFLKIKASMEEYLDDNTIIIDNGDTLEGSPLLKYHHLYEADSENPMVKAMSGFVRYYNLGNHDFNYGAENLLRFIRDIDAVCLCGNISYNGIPLGKKYVIHEFPDGERIALLGACTQYVPHWEKQENIRGFAFTDALEFFRDTVKEIKEKESVDAIVALYHGGYERDEDGNPTEQLTWENEGYAILQACPEIDVFITGHQHRPITGTFLGRPTVQTRANGVEFGLIDYDVHTKQYRSLLITPDKEAHKEDLVQFEA
ncbi:MAG: metallophosphoesterase, partial [Erysipelotrichaceae bacterium]|nr:metallophosphoesterase [Erysipelotrichaceae bacterium]